MRYPTPKRRLPWIALTLLTSCAGTSSSPAPSANLCQALPVQSYSAQQQEQVSNEILAAPAPAAWPGFVRDYGRLRAAVRACQAATP